MFLCLVRLSTGALCGGLYVKLWFLQGSPLEMAIQSAVACSEAKDDGLLVSFQLMERVLVWVVSFSLAVEDGFLFIEGYILLEVQTWYLHVPKTATREAIECNRHFPAAVRHGLIAVNVICVVVHSFC